MNQPSKKSNCSDLKKKQQLIPATLGNANAAYIWGAGFMQSAVLTDGIFLQRTIEVSVDIREEAVISTPVNAAFACECFLKSLRILKYGSYYKGHWLKCLFDDIGEWGQTIVDEWAESPVNEDKRSFDEQLEKHSKLFECMRYGWDGQQGVLEYDSDFLNYLMEQLHSLAKGKLIERNVCPEFSVD